MLVLAALLIVFFGALTSYEDLKFGRIRNRYILLAIVISTVYYVAYANGGLQHSGRMLFNVITALVVGAVAWYYRMWTAGDAKLFLAYSVMVPLETYQYGYVPYFPAIVIIVNTLLLIFGYLLLKLLLITDFQEKKMIFRNSFRPKNIAVLSAYLFGIFWFAGTFLRFIDIPVSVLVWAVLGMALIKVLKSYNEMAAVWLAVSLSTLRLLVDFKSVMTLSFWVQFGSMLFVFVVFLEYIANLGRFMFNTNIWFSELKPGMVVDEVVLNEDGLYKKTKVSQKALPSRDYLVDYTHKGLTISQINKLKELYKNKKIDFNHLRIQQTLPFAHLLLAGVILTILFQGSVIDYMKIAYFCPNTQVLSGLAGIRELVASACGMTYY